MLCESEETYHYNNTNTDAELGNLKASKNSIGSRKEEINNNSANNQFPENNNPINNNQIKDQMTIYVKCLEQKVRDQAARLSDAEFYRFLCENLIKQLNPQQTFPICESHLSVIANIDFNNSVGENSENCKMNVTNECDLSANKSNKSSIKKKNCIIPSGAQGNFNQNNNFLTYNKNDFVPIEMFNNLMEKYEKLKNNKDFINENSIDFNNLSDKQNEFNELDQEYYSIDTFDEKEIKGKYKKLFLYFKKIVTEKNKFIELFRKEKAYSEELKKQNMLLKESLENEILKFGFENNLFTSDNILDLNKLKGELDMIKRECLHYKNLTENYFHEMGNLKNINQMLLRNKEKIMQTFEEGLIDLDDMKEKITFLHKENSALIRQINSFNSIQHQKDKTLRNHSKSYSNKKETINNNPSINYNENINLNENMFRRITNNSKSKNTINKNDEFSNEKTVRYREEENISVKSNSSIISKTKRSTITKHIRNKSDDGNLNCIKVVIEKTNNQTKQKSDNNIFNNNNKEFEFLNHKETKINHNKYSDFNNNTARVRSSLSLGKLRESSNSNNNLYNSNNNLYSSNSNEILLQRITEYKKNYKKLNSEFEELIKIKSMLEIDNANINNTLNSLKEWYYPIEKALEEKQNEVEEYKKEKEKWNKDLANLLCKLNEMSIANGNSDYNLTITVKEYRRLYEEINLELEELKISSRKKIRNQEAKFKLREKEIQEKSNLIEKLNLDNQRLRMEIEFFRRSYEQIESEKQFLYDNEKIKEKELSLANESVQRLKMQTETLTASNKNLEKEIEEFKNEKNFLKQKYENEINSKFTELDQIKLLYENAKKENQKIKEGKKDANKLSYSDYISHEIETLNNKLNEYIVKEKQYNLTQLKLEKLEKENEILTSINEEAKTNRISLQDQIEDFVSKKESLEKEINYLRKNTEFSDEIYNEKNKEIEKYKKLISDIKNDNRELEGKSKKINRENEKLEEKNFDMQNDLKRKRDKIENLYKENLMLNDKVSVYKVNLNSLFSELKVNMTRLNQRANEDLDSLFTKEFSQNVLKLVSILNNFINNNYNENSIFDITKDFVNIFLKEFEAIYEKIIENNAFMQNYNHRFILMEDKLNNRDLEFIEALQNENNLKNKIQFMNEEIQKLSEYNKNLKDEIKIRNPNQVFSTPHNNFANETPNKRTAYDGKFYSIHEINNIKNSSDEISTYFERNKQNESFVDDLKNENSSLKQELEVNKRDKHSFFDFLQM